MLNLCGIVVGSLEMMTAKNFSLSGINSGLHNLPTYEMSMWVDYEGHHNTAQIQHCTISTTFHMWVDYDVPN
jgi:prephenate dehydratase